MSRVELFEAIRRHARLEELSIRALAERHGVHRRTVRQALAAAAPPARKPRAFAAPKLDRAKPLIDAMLREDLTAHRKQQHTARRVLARLVDEHQISELSYASVRDYVARRRPQIQAEAGRLTEKAFVPQTHAPGEQAEVDFGDVWLTLAGEKVRCFMFTYRLSFSGAAVHRVYASQGQEAFIEGHLEAFRVLGVPTVHIRYDNLKSAVTRVLFGRTRTESDRWVLFRSHAGFDAFYCIPGIEGAHEKGGVEGEVGRFRRNHLVPQPDVATLGELNARLERADQTDLVRRIENRTRTVGDDLAVERPLLRSLPADGFDPGLSLTPRVDRYARVMVRQCQYSVPARLIGRRVRVSLRASEVVVFDGRSEVARHARSVRKGSTVLLLDHYLEVLVRKPGALPGATALAQARAAGTFTPAHDAFWALARKHAGDGGGTRLLVEVLLLHRHLAHRDVVAGLTAAVSVGSTSPDVVAVEARKAAHARGASVTMPAAPAAVEQHAAPAVPVWDRVVSLTERRLVDGRDRTAGDEVELPADGRPLPSVAQYDELLAHPPAAGTRGA
ncbi:MAG: IS21 family transposase [Actinomycetota bacterium]|nr:IS21 family transposase [Actinomycetota bacterium]